MYGAADALQDKKILLQGFANTLYAFASYVWYCSVSLLLLRVATLAGDVLATLRLTVAQSKTGAPCIAGLAVVDRTAISSTTFSAANSQVFQWLSVMGAWHECVFMCASRFS
jgi:hypothetical protein